MTNWADTPTRLAGKTYYIQTFGCQMNEHDSERIDGMLTAEGAVCVAEPADADIVVYVTCCVREGAEQRLRGRVHSLSGLPTTSGEKRVVAIGGCIGQRDGQRLADMLPDVGVVFGTHNIANLPRLLEECIETGNVQVETVEESDEDITRLPGRRKQGWHAWLPITSGCNNFCTYCIVPYVRGREKSRKLEEIVAEAELLVADGVREITLLGQNVNSYGRDLYGSPRFAEVLRAVGATGIERLRFATSHPKDLSDETIAAMAEVDAVMPQLHLPVQSGSNRILNLMNRVYTREDYFALVDRLRAAIPDLALSTDIIVGFPGETEADFLDTLDLAERVGYAQAFTFIFSPREGTPAAHMEQNATHDEIQNRFDRLVEVIQRTAYECNQAERDTVQRVLVEGTSRRDPSMLSGRSRKNQVVHAPLPVVDGKPVAIERLMGTMVDVHVDTARTWYLSGTVAALPELNA